MYLNIITQLVCGPCVLLLGLPLHCVDRGVAALRHDREELLHSAVWRVACARLHVFVHLGSCPWPTPRATKVTQHGRPYEDDEVEWCVLPTYSHPSGVYMLVGSSPLSS